jgi:replicative DNA helicase
MVPLYLDAMMRARKKEEIRSLARGVAEGSNVEALQKALDAFSGDSGVKGGPALVRGGRGLSAALTGWREEAEPDGGGSLRIRWRIFPRFDQGGAYIREGDYAILAARPGRGKSSAAIQIAIQTAAEHKRPVLYVSLEMPARQVWQKALLAEAGVDDPEGRPFPPEDLDRVLRAKAYLETIPLIVLDQPPANLWRLKAYLSSLVQSERPMLTVIDYLGLIQAKGDEYQRVTLISQHLRAWALGNTPVLMLHQLSRASVTDARRPRMPRQSDLRGSGQIEQDATHIVFLHEAGGKEDPNYDYEQDSSPTVEMIALLSKARQGRPGRGERMLFHRAQSRMLPRA